MTAARERIVDTASGLFYEHGTRNVGVDRVIAESAVAKATLYAHFPSKDDLVVAYLQKADRAWRGKLETAANAAGDDPRDQLVGLFDALSTAGARGCAPPYHVYTYTRLIFFCLRTSLKRNFVALS